VARATVGGAAQLIADDRELSQRSVDQLLL
jgi:hypothetical protein